MCGRAIQLQSVKIRQCHVLCYFRFEKLKKSNVGGFDKESNITEKKILISTITPLNILGAFAEPRKKATISFIMSACQFAHPHETILFPVDKLL
jgi:hypothetical protein